ncbi:MAG TPA: GNAT family N-acetyltransferase [Verrucomicrobiae bacterium]|nr:GNAT family N-acetyltransferase [Verrucomicrobiae bacterium]
MEILEATSTDQLEQVRNLFRDYRAELAVEPCFKSFDEEIDNLPGVYSPPGGKLLLALVLGQPIGCVGLRPFPKQGCCEMKRLYVRPTFRGDKIGRKLAERILEDARQMGYSSMRLDSHLPSMQSAIAMYRKLGFHEVSPDPLEPIPGLIYMETQLIPAR